MDDFGYIYDHTDESDECYDAVEPGSIGVAPAPDVGALCDENYSQRPRRNMRRPARYDDYKVEFVNSQYVRRISKSRMKVKSHVAGTVDAMSVKSVPNTKGAAVRNHTKCANVCNANVSSRRKVATKKGSKTAHTAHALVH